MKAKIIARNHLVTKCLINGKPYYNVEINSINNGANSRIVFNAINETGSHLWQDIYNYLDDKYDGNMPSLLENTIERICL